MANGGSLYVYEWDGTNYNLMGGNVITPPSIAVSKTYFGYSHSISVYNSTVRVMVGSQRDKVTTANGGTNATNSGVIWIFDWNPTTSSWDLKSFINTPNSNGYGASEACMNAFGTIIAKVRRTSIVEIYITQDNGSSWTAVYTYNDANEPENHNSYLGRNDSYASPVSIILLVVW